MHRHTSPGWQNMQNMQSMVTCALPVAAASMQHLPAAFSAYGGWGEEILGKLVEPLASHLRMRTEAGVGGRSRWRGLECP